MIQGGTADTVRRSVSAWPAAVVEADAYEGIREGDETAFRSVAQPLQPALRRLAGLTARSSADAATVVVRTWVVALRGLDMFSWHTPFATWVARIVVEHGRTRAARGSSQPRRPPIPRTAHPLPGPADWSDLPWSSRWEGALPVLAAAHASLPLAQREVVHARDREGWPGRRVCEVLALPEVTYQRLLAEGRATLRDALVPLVGGCDDDPLRAGQAARVGTALRIVDWPHDRPEEGLDPRTVAVFRCWRAARTTGWRRLGDRVVPRAFRRGADRGVRSAGP